MLLTHLHPDHACGLANTDGTPTYPNARVYVTRQEAEFWLDQDIAAVPEPSQAFFLMARATVAPYAQERLLRYEPDAARARRSRQSMLANAAREHFWVAGAHLPFPGLGRVRATDGAYAWVPVEFGPIGDQP